MTLNYNLSNQTLSEVYIMATFNSKIKASFNLVSIKEAMALSESTKRGMMLDIIGTLKSIGLTAKEVSHNEWVIVYITDIDTSVTKIDVAYNVISTNSLDNDNLTGSALTCEFNAENLLKLIIGLEYGYAKANS